jgi:rfaE bifunctional protein kinase chain/domain/rfaE bifunctional protein nucleotidyltransferase chain/domain
MGKISSIEELAGVLEKQRGKGKNIVHCHGVFDLLHVGHMRHLKQAKGLGDLLVVTVTADEYVNKGPGRPVFSEDLRAEAIAALDCVDHVAINRAPMAIPAIELLRPNLYVKGHDYEDAASDRTGGTDLERNAIASVGGEVAFTGDITFSSSTLINRNLQVYPPEVQDYLTKFSSKHPADKLVRYLEDARSLKVLVIGETIIDEYLYCETLGKSGKLPVLAARHVKGEKFAGGVVAVANNVAAISDQPALLTYLGGVDSQEQFICEKLDPKIDNNFLYMNHDAPTIVKRRFVETYPFQVLFEMYLMDDDGYGSGASKTLCDQLEAILPQFDVVIAVDYGHGMIGEEAVEILSSQARFLAVNTQMNAGNRGFNTVRKYKRADYVCISEGEIRLEVRSRKRNLQDIVSEVGESLSCPNIVVTRGSEGVLCYSEKEGFSEAPALAIQVVDRTGAGDAVFSISSLCVAQKAPMDIVGFIANAVGAEAVRTVGHRSSIQRLPLYRYIETLLK